MERMERRALLLKSRLGYAPAVSVGILIAYAIQVYGYYRNVGEAVSVFDSLAIAAVDIALWLLLSPFIIALYAELAGKFSAGVQVMTQVLAAPAFAGLHVVLDGLINVALHGPFAGSYAEFMNALNGG